MNYIGLKCGICDEGFKEDDDVVVCPDCGTPMHRACYMVTKECPNREKHGEGYVFDGFEKIKDAAQGKDKEAPKVSVSLEKSEEGDKSVNSRSCPVCGVVNRPEANFCDHCGARLAAGVNPLIRNDLEDPDFSEPQFFASYAIGQNSDVAASVLYEENVTAGDVACYVAVNTPYYLGAFRNIKNGGKMFNFSAAVFSGVWFLYRKLYNIGALMLSLQALLYAVRFYFSRTLSMEVVKKLLDAIGLTVKDISSLTMEQYFQLSREMQKLPALEQFYMMIPSIILILQIAVMITCGAVANKLYYKKCMNGIKVIKSAAAENSLSRSETSQSLYLSGGVNAMLAGAFGLVYLFLFFMLSV